MGMLIRSTVAALDFNHNTTRKTRKSAEGKTMYKMKVGQFLLDVL